MANDPKRIEEIRSRVVPNYDGTALVFSDDGEHALGDVVYLLAALTEAEAERDEDRESLPSMESIRAEAVAEWRAANGYDDLIAAYSEAITRVSESDVTIARLTNERDEARIDAAAAKPLFSRRQLQEQLAAAVAERDARPAISADDAAAVCEWLDRVATINGPDTTKARVRDALREFAAKAVTRG